MTENKPIFLSTKDNFRDLINSNPVVLVDFYADWCGPCKKLDPIIEDKTKNKSIKVIKVSVDDFQDLAEEYNVASVPNVFLFKNGKIVDSFVGFDLNGLERLIKQI